MVLLANPSIRSRPARHSPLLRQSVRRSRRVVEWRSCDMTRQAWMGMGAGSRQGGRAPSRPATRGGGYAAPDLPLRVRLTKHGSRVSSISIGDRLKGASPSSLGSRGQPNAYNWRGSVMSLPGHYASIGFTTRCLATPHYQLPQAAETAPSGGSPHLGRSSTSR